MEVDETEGTEVQEKEPPKELRPSGKYFFPRTKVHAYCNKCEDKRRVPVCLFVQSVFFSLRSHVGQSILNLKSRNMWFLSRRILSVSHVVTCY